jgi:tetratricopeptide (TPR) repeat protein
MPDEALKVIGQIHAHSDSLAGLRANLPYLLSTEASAHLFKGDLPAAEALIDTTLKQHPNDDNLLLAAAQTYKNFGRYSNELAQIDRLLEMHPENRSLLLEKGTACVQLSDFNNAIHLLTRVVNLETNENAPGRDYYEALHYRAFSYFKTGRWDAAQKDYEMLQKAFPTGPAAYKIYSGLAEVALGKGDTNAAIRSYHQCLANLQTNSPAAETVRKRLAELKPNQRR